MKQLFLLIFLNLLLLNVYSYECVFNKLYNTPQMREIRLLRQSENNQNYASSQQNKQAKQQKHNKRILQTTARENIRITLDTTNLSTITLATNAANTTFVNLNYIKRAMQVAQRFFQLRLKVTPVARIVSPLVCQQFTTLANDRAYGISNSDLHIYVRYITINSTLYGYGATGVSCKLNTNSGTPDLQFSHGRPIVGRIQFNTFNIIDGKTMTNLLFSSITATSIHQMIHILGFDSSLYNTYLNTDGNYYTAFTQQLTPIPAGRPTTYVLTTPFVTAWAKQFFGCSTLPGMLLENQEGGLGSHWQRTAMYDQLMTGTSLGAQKGVSGLTYALLKDMGWYQVDDTLNDTSNYGYKKGCQFLYDACNGTTTFSEFCSYSSDTSRCASNFLGKAVCSTNSGLWADGCGIYGSYMNCVDQTTSDEGYTSKTYQKYGVASYCVYSTFGLVSLPSILKSRCYPYTCQKATKTIKFTIGSQTLSCLNTEDGNNKILSSMIGTLTCPNYAQFCELSRKLCTNWCSKNGFCTGGICHCLPGYYGKDCSITTCITGQYYEQASRQCVSSCPSGTYTSQFSKTCLPCDSACSQCRDQPHICTTCISTLVNPQYAYNSLCYSECPQKTYNAGDYCYDCDVSGSFCFNCSKGPTNCTSCSGGKYLQNPNFGACVDVCLSPYIRKDVVNFKCVQSCTDNLVQVGTTCDLCPTSNYKFVGNSSCVTNCPPKYFQDSTQRLCVQCDSSCLQCEGPYAQNCTACQTTSAQKYLLLRMCSSSCPTGYYTDDLAGKCQQCPDSNCVTCAYNTTSSSVYCKSCVYEYYLQPTNTCETTCPTYYFINYWNRTCDACAAECGDCYNANTSACISCRSGKYFLVNFTGGFCLGSCPTQKYVRSGSNCLQCHETCLTCNGTNANDCTSCINNLYRYSGMCRYVCPAGTFANSEKWECLDCSSSCKHCYGSGQDECTICNTGLYLNNHTCTDRCPDDKRQNAWNVCFSERMLSIILTVLLLVLCS